MTPIAVSVASIGNSRRDHAVLEAADEAVAGVAEGLDHPVVVGEHLGDEPLDAALAAGLGEVLEQELADPAALLGVLDQEGDLGDLDRRRLRSAVVGGMALVAAERDHPLRQQHHERHPVHVVDVGEPGDVTLGEVRHRGEEPVVLRLVGDPAVEVDEQRRASSGRIGRMCAVRPSRSRTSASQWRGATCASASAAVTGEIYRPEVSPEVAERPRRGNDRLSARRRYLRCSTRSPWMTTCGSSRTISSVHEPEELLALAQEHRGRSIASSSARPAATTWPPTSPALSTTVPSPACSVACRIASSTPSVQNVYGASG